MAHKLWSKLAKSTQQKYRRNNITPAQYNSAKFRRDNADAFRNAARGRAPKSFATHQAEAFGIDQLVPGWEKLSTAKQREFTDAFNQGLMKRNAPLRATGHGGFELSPLETDEKSHHYGHAKSFDDATMARFRFLELKDEMGTLTAEEETEYYRVYRALYNNHF